MNATRNTNRSDVSSTLLNRLGVSGNGNFMNNIPGGNTISGNYNTNSGNGFQHVGNNNPNARFAGGPPVFNFNNGGAGSFSPSMSMNGAPGGQPQAGPNGGFNPGGAGPANGANGFSNAPQNGGGPSVPVGPQGFIGPNNAFGPYGGQMTPGQANSPFSSSNGNAPIAQNADKITNNFGQGVNPATGQPINQTADSITNNFGNAAAPQNGVNTALPPGVTQNADNITNNFGQPTGPNGQPLNGTNAAPGSPQNGQKPMGSQFGADGATADDGFIPDGESSASPSSRKASDSPCGPEGCGNEKKSTGSGEGSGCSDGSCGGGESKGSGGGGESGGGSAPAEGGSGSGGSAPPAQEQGPTEKDGESDAAAVMSKVQSAPPQDTKTKALAAAKEIKNLKVEDKSKQSEAYKGGFEKTIAQLAQMAQQAPPASEPATDSQQQAA